MPILEQPLERKWGYANTKKAIPWFLSDFVFSNLLWNNVVVKPENL